MSQLIAYFSRAGNNYVSGAIKNLTVGNTEVAAKMMEELTGADLFKIEPIVAYSADYSECIEQAKQDLKRDARPELTTYPDSLEKYDTIYIGYPNYWGTMPVAVFTFLERFDFTGKIIKPFCTHEGSGMGSSQEDLNRLCSGAKIEQGLALLGGRVKDKDAEAAIKQWI